MPRSASVVGLAKRGVIPQKQFYNNLFFYNTVILAQVIARGRQSRLEWLKATPVAVGMPVTQHPPHRSVLALLTHTVLASDESPDIWAVEREANFGVRMQGLDFWDLVSKRLHELVPPPAGPLTPPSKLPPPHA